MSNIIDSIQLSGVTYGIKGSGGTETIELTQAQYDALVDKDPDVFYIITDAEAGDLTNYYTKTETNSLLSDKADTATTYTKTEVDNAITAATSTKQDTLVSSQNIKTINNQSILGSGNIDIQGGGSITVDTELSTTSENPVQNKVVTAALNGKGDSLQWDMTSTARKNIPLRLMKGNTILSSANLSLGDYLQYGSPTSSALCITGLTPTTDFTAHTADTTIHVTSTEKAAWNAKSDFSGDYNDLTNKPTIPTVPTSNTAFTNDAGYITIDAISGKVDTSTYNTYTAATDTALANKADTATTYTKTEIDTALASKQTTLTAGTGISIVDNVISATGGGGGLTEDDELLLSTALTDLNDRKIDSSEVKSLLGSYQKKGDYVTTNTLNTRLAEYETALDEQNVEEVTAYALNDLNNKFGGLKLTKITESEYAALTTKDENTLYIVVADPS